MGHVSEEGGELTGILALGDLEEVGDCLEGREVDIEGLVVEGLLKDANKVALELYQIVHQVGEEPIEDLQSGINLEVFLTVDKLEQQVQQVLPDKLLLLVDAATDFDK